MKDSVGNILINQKLVKKLELGTPEEAVGKVLKLGDGKLVTVVGVVDDFYSNSLKEEVEPGNFGAHVIAVAAAGLAIEEHTRQFIGRGIRWRRHLGSRRRTEKNHRGDAGEQGAQSGHVVATGLNVRRKRPHPLPREGRAKFLAAKQEFDTKRRPNVAVGL
jgi:hypothetical protein